jgi:hypothetical protein
MRTRIRLRAAAAATAVALLGVTSVAGPPEASAAEPVRQDVALTATTVPPGGLLTSFLNNQLIYCSSICPLLIDTAVTPVTRAVQAPGVFLGTLTAGDLLTAIGAAAASITSPTNAAAQAAIIADGSIPAKRALNAFEVAVVGLLRVVPAVAAGPPGVLAALEAARRDTFIALNLPVVPNPEPTVMPRGTVEVTVVGLLNIGGAIIFPGFNHLLTAAFATPDAVARELAATGDPLRAVAAGVRTAATEVTAAVNVVAESVATAVNDVRAEAANQTAVVTDSTETTLRRPTADESDAAVTPRKRDRTAVTQRDLTSDSLPSSDDQTENDTKQNDDKPSDKKNDKPNDSESNAADNDADTVPGLRMGADRSQSAA